MSTSEHFTYEMDKCPCGEGVILQHVDSPDNPWSRTTTSYQVSCVKCAPEWRARDGYLTSHEDETRKTEAFQSFMEAEKQLNAAAVPVIERHLASLTLKSMAAEHRYFQSLLVMGENLSEYRKRRNLRQTPAQICRPMRNPKWLLGLSVGTEEREMLEKLLSAATDAKHQYESLSVRTHRFTIR